MSVEHSNGRVQALRADLTAKLQELLSADGFDSIAWMRMTASTQDLARGCASAAAGPVSAVYVADSQSAGRGTHGRKWDDAGASLLMTVAAPLSVPVAQARGLPLAVGVAAAQALRSLEPAVRVKWPNDLWLHEGKLAGILCEACRDKTGRVHVAAGIGVNIAFGLKEARSDAAVGVSPAAGASPRAALLSLEAGQSAQTLDPLRVSLAALLARAICKTLTGFGVETMRRVVSLWPMYDAMAGRRVRVFDPESDPDAAQGAGVVAEGVVCGITPAGELVLETSKGRILVQTGSVRAV